MRATFGGYNCYDVVSATEFLLENGLPIPEDFRRASSFMCPLGSAPARGWLLMRRKDVESLGLDTAHDLLLYNDNLAIGAVGDAGALATVPTIPAKNLVIVLARAVVPSASNDPQLDTSLYLVEIADSRWLACNPLFTMALNRQYNVRAPASGGNYYASSKNSGTAWTWQGMVQDIWGTMSGLLGTAPSLPFTPNGTPENWIFAGTSAYVALNQVLCRIGCALKPVLSNSKAQGQYQIVQVGNDDAVADKALAAANNKLIHDEMFIEGVLGKEPYGVRVYFHRQQNDYGTEQTTPFDSTQWQTGSVYNVDVVGPDSTNAAAGVYHPIWDDLPALYDASGTLTNSSALSTRATERADDYYRMLKGNGGSRLNRKYSTLINVQPGSNLKGVAWRQAGDGGWITEVVRHPYLYVKAEDSGEWGVEGSIATQAPDFAPTFPNYPIHYQKIKLASSTPSGGYYDANVLQYDPQSSAWNTKEACWGVEQNGIASLTVASIFDGRLSGYASSRPIYTFDGGTGGTGSLKNKDVSTQSLSTGTQNNVAIPATAAWYASPSAAVNITGFTESGGGAPANGRRFYLYNNTSTTPGAANPTIYLLPNNGGSTYQILTPSGLPLAIVPGGGAWIEYSSALTKWIPELLQLQVNSYSPTVSNTAGLSLFEEWEHSETWPVPPSTSRNLLEYLQTDTLSGNANNYQLATNQQHVYVQFTTGGGSYHLTGIAGGSPGQLVEIYNADTLGSVTIDNNSGSSYAGNKILTSTLNNVVIYPKAAVILKYDGTYWRDVAANLGVTNTFIPPGNGNGCVYVTGDQTITGSTLTSITDLYFFLPSTGKWLGQVVLFCNQATPSDGLQLSFTTGPAALAMGWPAVNGCTQGTRYSTALATPITLTALPDSSDICIVAQVFINISSPVAIYPQVASNSGGVGGSLVIRKGSYWLMSKSGN